MVLPDSHTSHRWRTFVNNNRGDEGVCDAGVTQNLRILPKLTSLTVTDD